MLVVFNAYVSIHRVQNYAVYSIHTTAPPLSLCSLKWLYKFIYTTLGAFVFRKTKNSASDYAFNFTVVYVCMSYAVLHKLYTAIMGLLFNSIFNHHHQHRA